MRRLAKALHLLGAAGFIGAIAAQLAAARAGSQPAIDAIARGVLQPSLLLLVAGGLLSLAACPAWLERRWLWAKLLLTMLVAPIAGWWGPSTLARTGDGMLPTVGGWIALALCACTVLLAVWRPRLGQPAHSPP